MTIDWGSLAVVAGTTVTVTVAVVGIVTAGVVAVTAANRPALAPGRSWWASAIGWLCLAAAGLMVIDGLYLIIPFWH